ETQLAQLWQNAHDAGDADAMRSLGRELQKRGWEYGESVHGWPYIKPPSGFKAAPGVDATASLRAAQQQPAPTRPPLHGLAAVGPANPVVQEAARALQGVGGGALESIGRTIAGAPQSIADQLLMRNPATELLDRAGTALLPERVRRITELQDQQTQQ